MNARPRRGGALPIGLILAVVAAAGLLGWYVGRPSSAPRVDTMAEAPTASASASVEVPAEPVRVVGLVELAAPAVLRQTPAADGHERARLGKGRLIAVSAWQRGWLEVGARHAGSWRQGWIEWPDPLPEPPPWKGSVAGTIRFEGKAPTPSVPQARRASDHCKDQLVVDDDLLVDDTRVQDAFVTLAPVRGLWRTLDEPLQVVVRDCVLFPHLAGLLPGQVLRVANDDGILHHVAASVGDRKLFNLALPRGTPPVDRQLPGLGITRLGSDIHDWETAWVIAAGHPIHAVTDARGAFELGGAPPGSRWLVAFHPVLGFAVAAVEVGESPVQAELMFPTERPEPDACCVALAELEAADPFLVGACAASIGLERRRSFLRVVAPQLPEACSPD